MTTKLRGEMTSSLNPYSSKAGEIVGPAAKFGYARVG